MSTNHLYVRGDSGLLVVGFPKYIANGIAEYSGFSNYCLYSDFTFTTQFDKFNVLWIYKKDQDTEVPSLGLSSRSIEYIFPNNIGLV